MKIKSAKSFRTWFKNKDKARQAATDYWDENFMGSQQNDISGFFKMFHGEKEEIYNFLRKEVEMAEDGQAIYEFVQNAVDSESTHFYMFFNEQYLVAINNGKVFNQKGIQSILNIGQSYDKDDDPDKIGRYGIGFKLVHRLVGKSSGLDELLNTDGLGYRGPVLFSWSKKEHFDDFLTFQQFEYDDIDNQDTPWLLKILITNFPTQPQETIKNINFADVMPFSLEEVKNYQTFLNSVVEKIDTKTMTQGSMFFIKLGERKYEYLEKQKQDYIGGLSTSMHFLKSLQFIQINNEKIKKDHNATNLLEVVIEKHTDDYNSIGLTEKRDKSSDIKFKICYADTAGSTIEIKQHPNIYKFFPAVKEVNNLSFIIHCNVFELSSNRQNLTETPINKNLLSLLTKQLKEKMEALKSADRGTFKNLFTSILMSEGASSNSGSGWQSEFFYEELISYTKKNIPTKNNNYSDNPQNVKINKTKHQLNLSDFGLNDIEWFQWDNETDNLLIDEARSKLNIEEWNLRDVFVNADLDCLNDWVENLTERDYNNFLKELDKEYFSKEAVERLLEADLFRFSDENFYSINEIVENDDLVFLSSKVINIQTELKSLNFSISDLDISSFNFYDKVSSKLKSDEDLYDTISERTSTENSLTVNQKQNLFKNFINPATKFIGIGDETLKKIELFCDSQGEIKPLFQLVSSSLNTSSWLNPYKIKADEYFVQLNSYLIQEDDLFDKIILPNIEIIKDELTEVKEIKELVTFFKNKPRPFFNEYIIQKQTNGYEIIDKSDKFQIIPPKDERRTFIDFIETYLSDELIVLPYDFSDFNDQDGILKGEKLHSQILSLVDVDEHKETLVDIIHYNEPKRKFLQNISEFRFNSETEYTKEDYEYKILSLACNELKESDYQTFRDKVVIESKEYNLKLSEIPPFTDRIKIEDYELSLAEILPDTYQNSGYLSNLIQQFVKIEINEDRINSLLGINEGYDLENILLNLKNTTNGNLNNAEQVAFIILYHQYIKNDPQYNDGGPFKFQNIKGEWHYMYTQYINHHKFINEAEIFDERYQHLSNILNIGDKIKMYPNGHEEIIVEPYFTEEVFVCPYIITISDEQKQSFIEFLYNQWDKKNKKSVIKNIDWSKINNTKTENILGFNPIHSVYPSKYACENEVLPAYLIKWIDKEADKISFLSDLGIWTENSVVVELRKFLSGEIQEFQNNRLPQETRFNDDETTLFNSFAWLKENEFTLKTKEQFETFKKIVEAINDIRDYNKLLIQDEYNFELLEKKSTEWEESYYENWKEESNVSIFLYEGELPKIISLDEIEDYVFYSFNEGNAAIDDKNNIYINQNANVEKKLRKLELENDGFDFGGLWQNELEV